jgi:xanthine dehydrogenase accessory factor
MGVIEQAALRQAQGQTFALATVVRTVSVTAAKAGAKALIGPDGSIEEGWIGGGCARAAVVKAARQCMLDGQSRLVSIAPKDVLAELGAAAGEERGGVFFAKNSCPSQGTMDVFVEPVLPSPRLLILGASPVAVALARLAPSMGFAFVGSRRKAETLRGELAKEGVSEEALAAIKAPAGLDISAISADEIALSILAEMVAVRRRPERPSIEDAID